MKKIILLFALQFLIVGCTQDINKQNETANEINTLGDQISSTRNQLAAIQTQIDKINSTIYMLKDEEAIFTPSSEGYSTLRSNVGYFVVSLEKLTKYANGYKATFLIGNPSLTTFNGAKVTVKWGRALSKDDNFGNWYNSLKTETININNSLLPGVWNKVNIVLSPAESKDTGFISISLKTSTVYLNIDSRKPT